MLTENLIWGYLKILEKTFRKTKRLKSSKTKKSTLRAFAMQAKEFECLDLLETKFIIS